MIAMKKTILMLTATFCLMGSFVSCDNYETYADKKEKERDAISDFINQRKIKTIEESDFIKNGYVTDTTKREFAYMNNTGVYMQIVRKGVGDALRNGESATLKVRFYEANLLDTTMVLTNYSDPYDPDLMTISRTGKTYTASFIEGLMYSAYGASVPSGWLVPFSYLGLDGPNATEDISKVRLIVPHSQGHSVASGNVYPYFYEITFQR